MSPGKKDGVSVKGKVGKIITLNEKSSDEPSSPGNDTLLVGEHASSESPDFVQTPTDQE